MTSTARSLQFPLPISFIVEQLYILASARGFGKEHDAGILRVFTPGLSNTASESTQIAGAERKPAHGYDSKLISKVGFIGLGAMGYGMATSLVRAGYSVTAFDAYLPCVDKFITAGDNAQGVTTAAEATSGSDLIVMMVQNGAQVEDILFGAGHAIDSVSRGATILLSCTVPCSYARDLAARLHDLGKEISLVDAPVSGGAARAASGDLTVRCPPALQTRPNYLLIKLVVHMLRRRKDHLGHQWTIASHGWDVKKRAPSVWTGRSRVFRQDDQSTACWCAYHGCCGGNGVRIPS